MRKSIPFVQSPATKRGSDIHTLLETSFLQGWDQEGWNSTLPYEPPQFINHCREQIKFLHEKTAGWDIKVEQKEATDGYGRTCGYEDQHRMVRCIVDVQALNYTLGEGLFVDWKSGKSKGEASQLHLNAICTAPRTGIMNYTGVFVYLDMMVVDIYKVRLTLADLMVANFNRSNYAAMQCATVDTLLVIDKMRESFAKGDFLPTQNRYCRWCPIKYCQFYKGG